LCNLSKEKGAFNLLIIYLKKDNVNGKKHKFYLLITKINVAIIKKAIT